MSTLFLKSDIQPTSGNRSRGPSLVPVEVVVARTHSASESATQFSVKLPEDLQKVVRVELVQTVVRGAQMSGSETAIPYLQIEMKEIDVNGMCTDGARGKLFFALTDPTTSVVYSPPRNLRDYDTQSTIRVLTFNIRKPDGSLAVSGTDMSGIYLVLRFTRNLAGTNIF